MTTSPDEEAADEAREFAGSLSGYIARARGDELLGVYLMGSLAHGGFSRRYSDIDVGVTTELGLDPTALGRIKEGATQISSELAAKLSIFWTDRSFSLGRFPPLDRVDFLDHAVALAERERLAPPRPGLDEIRTFLLGSPFRNWSDAAVKFAASDVLDPKDHKPYLRALLYPARFVFSFMTGKMASNDDAVVYLDEHAPPSLDVELIRQALECRRAARDPDPLFGARMILPRQVAALAALVTESEMERPA